MTVPRYIDPSEGQAYIVDRIVTVVGFELALGTHPNVIAREVCQVNNWRVVAVYLRNTGFPELAAALAQAAQG